MKSLNLNYSWRSDLCLQLGFELLKQTCCHNCSWLGSIYWFVIAKQNQVFFQQTNFTLA